MIRLFTALCKLKFKSLSDEAIFQNATDEFKHYNEKCPRCGATGMISPHGSYSRNLVSYQDEKTIESRVSPSRFECTSCDTTHALLPDIIVPYSQYSLRFMLAVLIAYFERDTTITAICKRFGIAVSTLYAWKARLLEHKSLMLGELISHKKPSLAFVNGLFNSTDLSNRLNSFFRRHTFSFLQNHSQIATRSNPP